MQTSKLKTFGLAFSLFLILYSLFLILDSSVWAAKLLPQAKKGSTAAISRPSSTITVNPKLRNDRRVLLVNFGNLQNAKSVSYTLIYKTNGQEEGAGGTLSSLSGNQNRELLFGTCSKNVCTYHRNIKDARFEVTYTSTSGKKYLKRYGIRV